jgi:membrane protein
MRASNVIYGVEEGRPLWKTLPTRLLLTLVLLLMVAALAVAVTFTGPLAKEVGNLLGVGSAALTVWGIAKWPLILLGVMTIFALLDWGAPTSGTPSSAGSAPEA